MSDLSDAQRRAVAELLRLSPVTDDLGRRFVAAGHQLHLVGGSVRDALLGRVNPDLDFTTDARPDDILAIVRSWAGSVWETGIRFGTVGLEKDGLRLEVTTFRSEAYDPDSRKPEVVFGDSLEGDLARRDFTVNSMAVSLPDHEFTDPFGGLRDLVDRRLRTPGEAEESFSDDPLRMVRAARFVAQLRLQPTAEVVTAVTSLADRLRIVSAERIRDELTKLVTADHPVDGLRLLVDTGLADQMLPELPKMRLEGDPIHRHKDVYEHTLAVLENAVSLEDSGPDLVLRLAALLHDIGKPQTREFGPDGVTFHHHEVVGAKLARKRLSELRYPKQVVQDVVALVALHLRFHGYGRGEWTDSAVRRYVADAGPLLDRLNKLVRSDCTTRNRRKAATLAAAYDELEARIARLAAEEELAAVRPDLDGTEIMGLLGLEPGPLVGEAWRYLKEQRLDHGPLPRERAEELLRDWARDKGLDA